MPKIVRNIFADVKEDLRARIIGAYLILAALTSVTWVAALIAFQGSPVLLSTAFLAFSFGLRHAVDADHIAAIDNVTRKLMQQGRRPVALGLFFSLGHSSAVVLGTLAIGLVAPRVGDRFEGFKDFGSVAGTLVSGLFLCAIAVSNLVIFFSTYRSFRQRTGTAEGLDALLAKRGFIARICRHLFNLISQSWQMLPLGFLFALGFDTASEIAILGISASELSTGLPAAKIMIFPMLFTAGMTLVDTTDGVLMLGAYGWAFHNPRRKIAYNLTVTFVSSLVAMIVGGVELFGLLGDQMELKGAFWNMISTMNNHFGMIGYGIIALFVASWIASFLILKMKSAHEIGRADVRT